MSLKTDSPTQPITFRVGAAQAPARAKRHRQVIPAQRIHGRVRVRPQYLESGVHQCMQSRAATL